MAEHAHADLARDLSALGRSVATPAPSTDLATVVLERLTARPDPSPGGDRLGRLWGAVAAGFVSRRRLVAVVVGAVLIALLATPPVRATVADWFGFGGVRVERGGPETGPAAPPPAVEPSLPLTEAAATVGFPVSVPVELGAPDGVAVSADRGTVSMSWTTDDEGVLRLDQFDARLDYSVLKRAPGVFYAEVDGTDALWFEEPHEVALLEADGTQVTHSARLAGHTLIWQDGVVTLRLEGDVTLGRAVEIAESAVPVD